MVGPDSGKFDGEVCAYIADWANRVRHFIGALPRAEGDGLDEWERAFTALEGEARACLNSYQMGAADLEVVDRLVLLARSTGIAFAKALNIPVDEVVEGEEPEEVPVSRSVVPIGGHVLPPLPYPYDALEPYIDEQTMRLHHDKHHKSYVDGLNRAEREMARARETDDFSLIKHWEREAAFHGAGHYLHTLFWSIMSPDGGGEPGGALGLQIRQDFGDFSAFKAHFSGAAERVEGGGWALLVWAPRAHRLEILTAEKHQNLSQWDVVPLLVLDVWEHAYYLKYQNERRPYINAWWNLVNWPEVSRRFEAARQLLWPPA